MCIRTSGVYFQLNIKEKQRK